MSWRYRIQVNGIGHYLVQRKARGFWSWARGWWTLGLAYKSFDNRPISWEDNKKNAKAVWIHPDHQLTSLDYAKCDWVFFDDSHSAAVALVQQMEADNREARSRRWTTVVEE